MCGRSGAFVAVCGGWTQAVQAFGLAEGLAARDSLRASMATAGPERLIHLAAFQETPPFVGGAKYCQAMAGGPGSFSLMEEEAVSPYWSGLPQSKGDIQAVS